MKTIILLVIVVALVCLFMSSIINRVNDNNSPMSIQSHLLPTINIPVGASTISPTPIAGQSATIIPQIGTAAWANK